MVKKAAKAGKSKPKATKPAAAKATRARTAAVMSRTTLRSTGGGTPVIKNN